MLLRHPAIATVFAGVVLKYAGQRQAAAPFWRLQAEYARRADVVRGRGQVEDERLGEEVWAFLGRLVLAVDEDVGEGCGRVADVGLLGEGVEDLADPAVDGLGLVVLVGLAIGADVLFAGVDRGVIGLVVDQQKREV